MIQPRPIEPDPFEPAAEELIAECEGDARRAVIMLLGANHYLNEQVRALEAAVSPGYVRARLTPVRSTEGPEPSSC